MSITFLFPGQGSQASGMLHQLPVHKAVDTTMEEASTALQMDVLELDTSDAMRSTVAVQLALLISGVAMARILNQEMVNPSYVAGHSVGAFGAAVTSGVLRFQDALHLVKQRASLMEELFPSGYGMGVIIGIQPLRAHQIIEIVNRAGEKVFIANRNSSEQVTITGKLEGIEQALRLARESGARKAQLLQVSVPSHCPLLDPVAKMLGSAMEQISMEDPLIPYVANTTARLLYTAADIRNDLTQSVTRPVLWHDAATLLYERGTRLFIEMPPGHALSDLACQAFPAARSVAASRMRLDSIIYLSEVL
jgi:malonate decarboxylase epsilon subunit